MLNLPQLDALVSTADPAISDADLAAQLSTPIVVLKATGPTTMIKFRTLDDLFPDPTDTKRISDSLDATIAALTASADTRQQSLGAKLQRAKNYMEGTADTDGIDAANPSVRATLSQLVPTVLTQAQADAILARGATTTYLAGDVVQASDVTASRARVALAAGKAALLAWLEAACIAAIALCDEGQRSGTLPTKAQLQAAFDPAGVA